MTMSRVGVFGFAGVRAALFGEDEHVARREMGIRAAQRGARGPAGQTAVERAPGVELQLVVRFDQRDVVHQLEDHRVGGQRALVRRRPRLNERRLSLDLCQESRRASVMHRRQHRAAD